MKITFENIANDIKDVAKLIDEAETIGVIDMAYCRLRVICNELDSVRMVDLDKREIRVK